MSNNLKAEDNKSNTKRRFKAFRHISLVAIPILIFSLPYFSPKIALILSAFPVVTSYIFLVSIPSFRQRARTREIEYGFPDALDVILICIEAGQALSQALTLVAGHMKTHCPSLAHELERVTNEINAGKDRTEVFRDFALRCNTPDITSFVAVIIQSGQYGTSIASAISSFSEEMRDKRYMRAEEKANMIPTKMTLATMLLTVPPLLLLLVGPSVYEIYLSLTPEQP